jgi:hypothetical protein
MSQDQEENTPIIAIGTVMVDGRGDRWRIYAFDNTWFSELVVNLERVKELE